MGAPEFDRGLKGEHECFDRPCAGSFTVWQRSSPLWLSARSLALASSVARFVLAGVPAADRDAYRCVSDHPRHSGEPVRRQTTWPSTAPLPSARAELNPNATPSRSSLRFSEPRYWAPYPEPPAYPISTALPRALCCFADFAAATSPPANATSGVVTVTIRTESYCGSARSSRTRARRV